MITEEIKNWSNEPSGAINVTWADGSTATFSNLAEIQQRIAKLDTDRDFVQKLLLSWFLARSPQASNPNLVKGKTMTFDLTVANPIRVQ